MAFAKLKVALRAAAARTIPDLWQAIADALRRFTPIGPTSGPGCCPRYRVYSGCKICREVLSGPPKPFPTNGKIWLPEQDLNL